MIYQDKKNLAFDKEIDARFNSESGKYGSKICKIARQVKQFADKTVVCVQSRWVDLRKRIKAAFTEFEIPYAVLTGSPFEKKTILRTFTGDASKHTTRVGIQLISRLSIRIDPHLITYM
jgi:hypothetical protein